jgi:hypothetical protein
MKSLVATAVSAAFCFCLLSAFSSKTAQAQPIITGSESCTGELQQLPNGLYGCTKTLPVHHLGKGGPGGVNPRDYGMCGILSLGMEALEQVPWKDDVQIVVDSSGNYALQLGVSSKTAKPPVAQFTCVYFWGFKGLPSISHGVGFTPADFSSGTTLSSKPIPGSDGYACIWAGFLGDLGASSSPGQSASAQSDASAQYDSPVTKYSAQNTTSYAFCSGYTAPGWKGWHYLNNTGTSTSTPKSLGKNEKDYWCYIDLIKVNITTFGPGLNINAQINISSSGDYSLGGIFSVPGNSVSMGYNCLPLTQ